MDAIKVGIIADWERAARRNAWVELLQTIGKPKIEVTVYRVSDLMVDPSTDPEQGLQKINAQDVLIINWDAANGDPEFGAHLTLRWLEHRRPELLHWIGKGNVLIVESQTVLGVPCHAAYDAAAGPGQLPVSGLADPRQPLGFRARTANACRKTKHFPTEGGFEDVDDRLIAATSTSQAPMFPKTTTGLLMEALKAPDPTPILYRGWFRRTLPGSRQYDWVSLLERSDVGRLRRHSVLKLARVEKGALFAGTMLLADTGQVRLVEAMVRCAGGNTSHLPKPKSMIDSVRKGWRTLLTVFGGAIAGLLAGQTEAFVKTVAATLRHGWTPGDSATTSNVVKFLFVPAGMLLFEVARLTFVKLRRTYLDYVGY